MHDAPRRIVKWVSAMHGAPVIPHDQIAHLPRMRPGVFGLGGILPQHIEQCLAFLHREARNIGIRPPPQEKRGSLRLWVSPQNRVARTRGLRDILDRLKAVPQATGRCKRGIVDRLKVLKLCLNLSRQGLFL